MTFSEALLAALKQQRSTLLGNGQKPLCDVILRCGNIATRSHSSVLASVSKYFERILTDRHSTSQVCKFEVICANLTYFEWTTFFFALKVQF